VREKGRWRTRACHRRDGAFNECDDGFAGAASFATYTDRHGGFAVAEIILALCSIVSLHVFPGSRAARLSRRQCRPSRYAKIRKAVC
jgi:hypothetical protein